MLTGLGLDVSGEVPKGFDADGRYDRVVTMGCGDACPVYPGRRYVDWVLDDPAGPGVEQVRPVRDEIERRVRGLLVELEVPARA